MGEFPPRADTGSIAQRKLIERVSALTPSVVGESNEGVGVMLTLPGEMKNGVVRLTYERYAYDLHSSHTTIVSYIESPQSETQRDPLQGVATAFTMAAIIDEAARLCKHPLTHKVLANKNSIPLFERLRDWNIYQYSDSLGNPRTGPVADDLFSNKVFYSCVFPNMSVEKLFEKFRVPEAAKRLVETYPTPIRLIQHKLAQKMHAL